MAEGGWLINGETDLDLQQLDTYLRNNSIGRIITIDTGDERTIYQICQAAVILNSNLDYACSSEKILRGKVRLAWIDDTKFRAIAVASRTPQSPNFIVLSQGAFNILFNFYKSLFASPSFLPSFGNILYEIQKDPIIIVNDASTLSNNYVSPLCPIRGYAASLFMSEALRFLLFHELSHISHGHLGTNEFHDDFATVQNSENKKFLKFQTMEMDADSGAVILLFNKLMNSLFLSEEEAKGLQLEDNLIRFRENFGVGLLPAVKFFSIVTTGLACLMYGKMNALNRDNMFSTKHPHPEFRLNMILATLHPHIARNPEVSVSALQISQEAAVASKAVYDQIDWRTSDKEYQNIEEVLYSNITFTSSKHAAEYRHFLTQCWRELYPIFNPRKLTLNKLAPPTVEATLEQALAEYDEYSKEKE